MFAARRDTHHDVAFIIHFGVDNLEAFKCRSHRFRHFVRRVVLGVDEAVPAV